MNAVVLLSEDQVDSACGERLLCSQYCFLDGSWFTGNLVDICMICLLLGKKGNQNTDTSMYSLKSLLEQSIFLFFSQPYSLVIVF